MGLESGTYISDLVSSNPGGTDLESQGDDHIRLIKALLQGTFTNAARIFRFFDTKAAQTSTYSISETADLHKLVPFNATSGTLTANLPSTTIDGWWCLVMKTDSSANAVTLDPSGAGTINGASSITLTKQYQSILIWWDNQASVWVGAYFSPAAAYYSGGQDIPFSDLVQVATTRLAGRNTAGTGDLEEVAINTALDWLLTTRGDIIVKGASTASRLALGTSGQVPVSNGTDLVYGSPPIPAFATGSYATYTALSTAIPADDTIPQVGEGTEIISTAITPIKTSSIIRATFSGFGVADANAYLTAALFKDGAANAVQVATERIETLGGVQNLKLDYSFSPGSLSAITFSVRVGANSGSVAMNGANVARLFGGAASCKLMLQEIFTA